MGRERRHTPEVERDAPKREEMEEADRSGVEPIVGPRSGVDRGEGGRVKNWNYEAGQTSLAFAGFEVIYRRAAGTFNFSQADLRIDWTFIETELGESAERNRAGIADEASGQFGCETLGVTALTPFR
jgi:hypothetical protein